MRAACVLLLRSILGDAVMATTELTPDGIPTMQILGAHWTWRSIVLVCLAWAIRADYCDRRRMVVPPAPSFAPPPGVAAAPSQVFSDEQRQHARAAWSEFRYNPSHLLGFMSITWRQRGHRWVDHLTHLPLDFFAPPGPGATTIIAHRIHGLPFSFGWRTEVPAGVEDWRDEACNVVIESRATNFLRGGRPGACLFDVLDRWAPFAVAFSQAGRALCGDAPLAIDERHFLTPEEIAAVQADRPPVSLNSLAYPHLLVNRVQPAEKPAWWSDLWGFNFIGQGDAVIDLPGLALLTPRQRLLETRVAALEARRAPMPWWVR